MLLQRGKTVHILNIIDSFGSFVRLIPYSRRYLTLLANHDVSLCYFDLFYLINPSCDPLWPRRNLRKLTKLTKLTETDKRAK